MSGTPRKKFIIERAQLELMADGTTNSSRDGLPTSADSRVTVRAPTHPPPPSMTPSPNSNTHPTPSAKP